MSSNQVAHGDKAALFRVPLVCSAAPNIGCGTLAGPVFSRLQRLDSVNDVWLNREGTLLAVRWTREPDVPAVLELLHDAGLDASQSDGETADLRELERDDRWVRAGGLDDLSREEAGVIANRLVRRLGRQVLLSPEKQAALSAAIEAACAEILTETAESTPDERLGAIAAALPRAASAILDARSLSAFNGVLRFGARPLAGEA